MSVDTSAIMAMLLDEPMRQQIEVLMRTHSCRMSAATRLELGIVVESRRGLAGTLILESLLDRFGVEVVSVDARAAAVAMTGWRLYGKGRHRAGLNYGDCFSYALAMERNEPLLFIGDDFGRTDVAIALGS